MVFKNDVTLLIELLADCIFIFLTEFSFWINFIKFNLKSKFEIFIELFSANNLESFILIFIAALVRFSLIKASLISNFNLEL